MKNNLKITLLSYHLDQYGFEYYTFEIEYNGKKDNFDYETQFYGLVSYDVDFTKKEMNVIRSGVYSYVDTIEDYEIDCLKYTL